MRSPTPLHEQMAWWRSALAGEKPPMHDSDPKPGFYQRRLVKGGPMVPVRIWLDQAIDDETGELIGDETLRCEVNGRPADPEDVWSYVADSPISEADFDLMRRRIAWATAHAPDHPIATPNKPVDWTTARVPF